ncbi:hypothetical protein ACFX2I_001136 [Malus domestica]
MRRERSLERRSTSPHDSRSPKRCRASPPVSNGRRHVQSPEGTRPQEQVERQANTLIKTTTSRSRTNIRWRLRRQHLNLSYTPSIKLNFLSLSQPKVDESNDFLPWLERKAGAEISVGVSIGKPAHGTSLFASKSITAGDCILKVPYNVQLAPDNLVPELKDLLSDGVGDAAK